MQDEELQFGFEQFYSCTPHGRLKKDRELVRGERTHNARVMLQHCCTLGTPWPYSVPLHKGGFLLG